ncbi:MAG: response regulator [bacterium]|nr:response regulator [bacterium]
MKTVLVVDDDQVILTTIVRFLGHYAEDLELLTAKNGQEAVEVLEQRPVDLLLTDLYMPIMDGFELLAHMVRNFSSVPIIVMSGYEVPEMGGEIGRHGALHYLEKPFDFPTLADTVTQTLARTSKGHLTGVSLLGFLQLLNFEKKSCLLTVESDGRTGRLHVREGELINADSGRLQGESAVSEILTWDDCEIDVSVPQRVERLINRPLHGVILEAARDLDESRAAEPVVESEVATVPVALDEGALGRELLLELAELLERPSLKIAGAIGVALVDVQQAEVVGYRCFQYWPDFAERALATVAAVRRRLEIDDGEQVEELMFTLEALLEIWRPLGRERRMVFYLLMNRQSGVLDSARWELVELEDRVRELLETP